MCTLTVAVLAASAVALPRTEAVTVGSLAGLRAAIRETNLAQDVAYDGYYQSYGYLPVV